MRVKTLRRHGYDRQIRMPGEEYEIKKEKHARLLEACGKIQRIPDTVPAPPKEEPKPEKKKPAKKKTAKKKSSTKKKSGRSYKRKDMRAE